METCNVLVSDNVSFRHINHHQVDILWWIYWVNAKISVIVYIRLFIKILKPADLLNKYLLHVLVLLSIKCFKYSLSKSNLSIWSMLWISLNTNKVSISMYYYLSGILCAKMSKTQFLLHSKDFFNLMEVIKDN